MFIAHNLQASRVNLLMNDFAAGLPSPLAFLGLGAAIAPELGAERWAVRVLPILHDVQVSEGRTKPEMAPKDGRFTPIETVEDLIGTVRVSLLLEIPGCSDEHQVSRALIGRRIAGGVIHNDRIEVERVASDGRALTRLERGFAMIRPEQAALGHVATGGIEDLAKIASLLYPAERRPNSGWLVAVAVGHRLLEDPATAPRRANTRDPAIPHVFTEPVVGVAELVSIRNRRMTDLDEDGLADRLWTWTAEGSWITGHSFYHPDRRAAVEESAHAQA